MPPDPHALAALKDKVFELRQTIVTYEEQLDRVRKELSVVTATIAILHRDGGRITDDRPLHVRNLFKRGETWRICRAALAEESQGLTTRHLATLVLRSREFDAEDPILLRGMVNLLANSLRKHVRKRELVRIGTGNRSAAWRLPSEAEKAALPPPGPVWHDD